MYTKSPATERDQIPVACVLTALSPDQRKRESILLGEHRAARQETRERSDGYSYRYPPDIDLFVRIAELVALEHRCCPFLDFQLEWQGGEAAPWLHVTGGDRAKEFVSQTFGGNV
jgi:hypothetical protein